MVSRLLPKRAIVSFVFAVLCLKGYYWRKTDKEGISAGFRCVRYPKLKIFVEMFRINYRTYYGAPKYGDNVVTG